MQTEYQFTCELAKGMHARPASMLEKIASQFQAEIRILNHRTGKIGNAKSILSLISADLKYNDPCKLFIRGNDKDLALAALKEFINQDLAHYEEVLPELEGDMQPNGLPLMLREGTVSAMAGQPVVPGIARAAAVCFDGIKIDSALLDGDTSSPHNRFAFFEAGLQRLTADLEQQLSNGRSAARREIVAAHLSLARDPELRRIIGSYIQEKGQSVARAIMSAQQFFQGTLGKLDNPMLRERILDVKDVCIQLLTEIYGKEAIQTGVEISEPSICFAENITPSQFFELDLCRLRGLVFADEGTTSHTIILARSFGIPTITGIADYREKIRDGDDVIIDANQGLVFPCMEERVKRYYELEKIKIDTLQMRRQKQALMPAVTLDQVRLEIAANISIPDETAGAFENGAEAIGLYRTENLFMQREKGPSEEEQFEIYRKVARDAGDRKVILRTLDVGGDKKIGYFDFPQEKNPFLGFRAVRFYPEYEQVFTDQLRAIIRASAFGTIWLMIPMVCCVQEIQWVRRKIREIQKQFDAEEIAFDPAMPVGIMVEIPSVAFAIEPMARYADFFTIGTNDLLQYFLAVDRLNEKVGQLYTPLHPSFIQLLEMIVRQAHARGKWVGMCGEMAAELRHLPLLIGLGLDELSMATPSIPSVKEDIRRYRDDECRRLIPRLVRLPDSEAVNGTLDAFHRTRREQPLFDEEMIVIDSDCRSKAEVIKQAADNLYIHGRCKNPHKVEEALWRRENVFATGMGYGFAIPHCKTDEVICNSISVIRLQDPVLWSDGNESAVRMVVVLAIRESGTDSIHLEILTHLARKIMHEDFRAEIMKQDTPAAMLAFFRTHFDKFVHKSADAFLKQKCDEHESL